MPSKTRKSTRAPRSNWGIQGFLNDAHHPDRGYLKGRIVWEDWSDAPTIDLAVADCQRIVTLDFGPDGLSKKERAVRIRKLRRLQRVVNSFVEAAVAAIETAEPLPKTEQEAPPA